MVVQTPASHLDLLLNWIQGHLRAIGNDYGLDSTHKEIPEYVRSAKQKCVEPALSTQRRHTSTGRQLKTAQGRDAFKCMLLKGASFSRISHRASHHSSQDQPLGITLAGILSIMIR
jgi:hypothetical protein